LIRKQYPELRPDYRRLENMERLSVMFGQSYQSAKEEWLEYWTDKFGKEVSLKYEEEISND
jgi:hypothetical protein